MFVGCSNLLRSMLCVDAEARITMEQIKEHAWVVYNDNWKCEEFPIEPPKEPTIDETILAQMELFGFTRDKVLRSLKDKSYDPASATFNLLQLRKGRSETPTPMRVRRFDSENQSFLSGFVSMPTSAATSPCSSIPCSPKAVSPRLNHSESVSPTYQEPRPVLARVQSQKMEHRRGRSFTGDDNEIPQRFAKISPKRKRSSSEKHEDSDEEDSDLGVSTSSPRVKFETPQSGLRFELSKNKKNGEETTSTKKETPTIEIAPATVNELIRESKPKPRLRKTFSDKDFQNKTLSPRKNSPKPITKPVWSDQQHGTPDLITQTGKKTRISRSSVHKRKSHTVTRETAKNMRGTWSTEVEISTDGSKLSSRMFSVTKQMIAKRSTEKEDPNEPRALRTPFSATSSQDPKEILSRIQTYFKIAGVPFEPVGAFALKGLIIEYDVRFEIEVCAVPNLQNLYSVRTKRVDGEWEKYKEFCEDLFEALDIK